MAGENEELSEKWDEVRKKIAENIKIDESAPVDSRSLYEKLQEQKKMKIEAEMEEQKSRNAVRVLDNDDFEYLEGLEASKRAQERALEEDTRRQMELVKARNKASQDEKQLLNEVANNPRLFKPTTTPALRQKDILRAAIVKKKDPKR